MINIFLFRSSQGNSDFNEIIIPAYDKVNVDQTNPSVNNDSNTNTRYGL